MPIGISPRPGKSLKVSRAKIKGIVAKKRPDLFNDINWSGSNIITLSSQGQEVALKTVYQLAKENLNYWLASKGYQKIATKRLTKLNTITVPVDSKLSFAPIIRTGLDKASKRMAVWVDLFVDGERYHSYQLWFEVSAIQEVLVSKVDVSKGVSLHADMLERAWIDITDVKGVPVLDEAELWQKQLKSPLKAGNVIVASQLFIPSLVTKGQLVKVHVSLGTINIETTALAMGDGQLKDAIQVLNPLTKKSYTAIVVDQNRVKVE